MGRGGLPGREATAAAPSPAPRGTAARQALLPRHPGVPSDPRPPPQTPLPYRYRLRPCYGLCAGVGARLLGVALCWCVEGHGVLRYCALPRVVLRGVGVRLRILCGDPVLGGRGILGRGVGLSHRVRRSRGVLVTLPRQWHHPPYPPMALGCPGCNLPRGGVLVPAASPSPPRAPPCPSLWCVPPKPWAVSVLQQLRRIACSRAPILSRCRSLPAPGLGQWEDGAPPAGLNSGSPHIAPSPGKETRAALGLEPNVGQSKAGPAAMRRGGGAASAPTGSRPSVPVMVVAVQGSGAGGGREGRPGRGGMLMPPWQTPDRDQLTAKYLIRPFALMQPAWPPRSNRVSCAHAMGRRLPIACWGAAWGLEGQRGAASRHLSCTPTHHPPSHPACTRRLSPLAHACAAPAAAHRRPSRRTAAAERLRTPEPARGAARAAPQMLYNPPRQPLAHEIHLWLSPRRQAP